MKLFMLRHAHSMGNEKHILDSSSSKFDFGLSKKGKIQAENLILKLNKYNFDIFIISPLKRTIETIKPFLKTLHNPQIITNQLTLERNAGEFIGKPVTSIKEFYEKNNIKNKVSFKPQKGESILEVYEKAKKFLEFLKKNFVNKNILICGHKNFLMCFEILLRNKNIQDYYLFKPLENSEIKEFEIN